MQLVLVFVTIAGVAAVVVERRKQPASSIPKPRQVKTLVVPPSPCPDEMTLAGATCVDRWEGSLLEKLADGTEVPYTPYVTPAGHEVRAVSKPGVVPQGHISFIQAKRSCAASGKRLCRVDEWKTACKGPKVTKFPYGNEYVPGRCTDTGRVSPLSTYYNGDDKYTAKAMNDSRLNQTPNSVAKTGEAKLCTNEYGAFDMVGNLHEWLDDGAFHGGYYLDVTTNRGGCEYMTVAHDAVYFDYSIGFRCCGDVR